MVQVIAVRLKGSKRGDVGPCVYVMSSRSAGDGLENLYLARYDVTPVSQWEGGNVGSNSNSNKGHCALAFKTSLYLLHRYPVLNPVRLYGRRILFRNERYDP